MSSIAQQTDEVIAKLVEIQKAGPIVKDVTQASTNLNAYNLEPGAKLLQPVYSPFRNRVPRVGNTKGGTVVNWKVITGLNINRLDPFTARGTKASTVSVTAVDKAATFATISKGDFVEFQAQWAGLGLIDNKAEMIKRLLATVMQLEEQALLFGRITDYGTITTPTTATATTGGTIAAATYDVICRAVSFPLLGQTIAAASRGKKSAAASQATTGATSTLSASTTPVEGAVAYEWYVGVSPNAKLEAITEVAHVKLTALLGTGVLASATADNANDALAFDGLFPQITAALSPASATLANGVAGAGTKLALSHIDDLLQNMWDNSRVNPDVLWMNSREHKDIANLTQAANGTMTQIFTASGDQVGLAAGVSFSYWVNKTTGKMVTLAVHPFWPKGTIMASTFTLPFSIPGLVNIVEVETRQDYLQLDYPVVKPAWESEVLVDETLKVYFPGAFGWIKNIASQLVGA